MLTCDKANHFIEVLPVAPEMKDHNENIYFSWNSNEHHFELNLCKKRKSNFFYFNRLTSEISNQFSEMVPDFFMNRMREVFEC
jgi:hypothetical protein